MGDLVRGWVVGKGLIIDVGYLTVTELETLKSLSGDARQKFVEEYVAKYPEAYKLTAGYCQTKKTHVAERDCLACAQTKGFKRMAEWEICRGQNLSRMQER